MKTKTILIIVGTVFAIFFVPVIIHWAYNTNCPKIVTDWGATDVLFYWGSVIGGLATLSAIFINILYGKRKERHQAISSLFSDSLRNFDMRVFLTIHECADEYDNSFLVRALSAYNQHVKKIRDIIPPDTIPYLIEKANNNMFLGMKFLSDEKTFFYRVIEDLKEFTKDYTSLLLILEEHKDDELRFATKETISYWLDRFLEKNKDLCRKYKEMFTSVEKAITEYEHS